MTGASYSIAALLRQAATTLSAVSDAPRLDAERLLLHVLQQREAAWLYSHADQLVATSAAAHFTQLVTQRLTGLPLAYILGYQEFYGRPFLVTPAVLIPRPDTEALIDQALAFIHEHFFPTAPLRLADIGTGSGCVAVTLALELRSTYPGLQVIATDISPAALAVATTNARRHQVVDNISFRQGDMLAPLDLTYGKPAVDLIVSNPPYVPTSEIDRAGQIPDTVGLLYEPRKALDGGEDGQRYITILRSAGVPLIVEGTGGTITTYA